MTAHFQRKITMNSLITGIRADGRKKPESTNMVQISYPSAPKYTYNWPYII